VKLAGHAPYLRVADMARSLEFYVQRLGFSVQGQLDDEAGIYWASLEKDGMRLMICNRPSRFLDFVEHGPGHFHDHDEGEHVHFHGAENVHDGALNVVTYLYVDDVDAAFAELQQNGIEPVDSPEDKYYGVREFLVRDPDGYYYAIAQTL
jgi:uncharacterized glyoxalase superfamily protein PhnB